MSRRIEWDALGEQAQIKMCVRCIRHVAHDKGMKGDPLAHIGGVWVRIAEQLDETELDLSTLVWRCAAAELQQNKRHEYKAAGCADFEVVNADGDRLGSILDTVAGVGSVENEAVLRVDFGRVYDELDAVNQTIVCGLALGLAYREISQKVSMTPMAISKRVRRMREMLAPCMMG